MPSRTAADLIRSHEGLVLTAYPDPGGGVSVGWGRNLTTNGLSPLEADELLQDDLDGIAAEVSSEPWWETLNDARQAVVVDMIYALGWAGFKSFEAMLQAIKAGAWYRAADEMLDSQWARTQAPERAAEDAQMMRSGLWPEGFLPAAEPDSEGGEIDLAVEAPAPAPVAPALIAPAPVPVPVPAPAGSEGDEMSDGSSSKGSVWARVITSPKLVGAVATLAATGIAHLGFDVPPDDLTPYVATAAAWLVGQGVHDAGAAAAGGD